MNGPLSWLRVVDLTDMRGALCARILADLGADVVRVDSPSAPLEWFETTKYRYRNANKRGVRIDLDTTAGREHSTRCLPRPTCSSRTSTSRVARSCASISRPFRRPTRGCSRSHLQTSACRVRGRRGASGRSQRSQHRAHCTAPGFPELPPCNGPGHLAHDAASIYGAIGAIAAVLDRARHGSGQTVVSVQEAALAATVPWSIPIPDYRRIVPSLPLQGTRSGDGSYWVLPAADGWIRTVTGRQRHWEGFV